MVYCCLSTDHQCNPNLRSPGPVIPLAFLTQAVSSYLHFSQLRSWIVASGGGLPFEVLCRCVCVCGHCQCVFTVGALVHTNTVLWLLKLCSAFPHSVPCYHGLCSMCIVPPSECVPQGRMGSCSHLLLMFTRSLRLHYPHTTHWISQSNPSHVTLTSHPSSTLPHPHTLTTQLSVIRVRELLH